jgi:hypothetical protein
VDLRRPQSAKAQAIGTATHDGLEAFDAGGDVLALELAASRTVIEGGYWSTEGADVEAARVRAMLRAYHDRWSAERDDWEVVESEGEWRADLRGVRVAGKRDAIWRSKASGALVVVERKTTSDEIGSAGDDYWQRLALDSQIALYAWEASQRYREEVSILYDVIRKPMGKPRIADRKTKERESLAEFEARLVGEMLADPGKYLVRRVVHQTREQGAEIMAELAETASEIATYRGSYPRNDQACQTRYGRCPFLGVCTGTESLDSFPRADGPHVELKTVTEEAHGSEYSDCPL